MLLTGLCTKVLRVKDSLFTRGVMGVMARCSTALCTCIVSMNFVKYRGPYFISTKMRISRENINDTK